MYMYRYHSTSYLSLHLVNGLRYDSVKAVVLQESVVEFELQLGLHRFLVVVGEPARTRLKYERY